MGKLDNKKILMVIPAEEFRDEELNEPKAIFSSEGAKVTVASSRMEKAKGMLGAVVQPDTFIKNVNANDFEAIVVVGGMGSPEYLWNDSTLHKLLQEGDFQGKVIASICLSGVVLANAGLLNNVEATVYETPESLNALRKGNAKYLKQDVVASDRIITANGPHAAKQFALAIIKRLL